MRYENVCTACIDARCSHVRYLGRGNIERSVPTGGRRTWHAFGQPSNVDFMDGVPCAPPPELASHTVVPVTHTRSGYAIGLWLYYARGCSDLGWDLGTTILATNRIDLALKLMDKVQLRLQSRGVDRSAVGELPTARPTPLCCSSYPPLLRCVPWAATTGDGALF